MVARAIQCPRCGYALEGAIQSWHETCPLPGRCSECGLDFDWADLLSTKRLGPRWCVEYGRLWSVPVRALATAAGTCWPPAFWRSLRMHHRPRWRRLVGYILLLAATLYVPLAAGQGWRAWRAWPTLQINPRMGRTPAPAPRGERLLFVAEAVARPWAESYLWIPRIGQGGLMIPGTSGAKRFRVTSPRALLEMRFPLIMIVQGSSMPTTFAFPAIVAALMPVGFVTLPISRRRARVRWSHLVRICLYGLAIPYVAALALAVTLPLLTRLPHVYALEDWFALLCFVALPIAIFAWWGCAMRWHLKLSHPWGVAGALLAMSVLAALVCGYFWFVSINWGYVLLSRPGG